MKSHRIDKAALTTVLLALVASGSAMAQDHEKDTKWEKSHPRREQVNERLKNQNKRINHEVREGELTKAQANKLHAEDRQIRHQ
jgi:hypothetical protein